MAVTSVVASTYAQMETEAHSRFSRFFELGPDQGSGGGGWEVVDAQIEHVFWADPPVWRGTFTAVLE